MAEIGAFRDPIQGKHDKKKGGKIPLETCVFTLDLESTTQQKRLHSGLRLPLVLGKEKKKEKKIWERWGKKRGREESEKKALREWV